MEVFRVFATLGLDRGEFDRGLDAAQSRLQNLGTTLTGAGQALTIGVTAPIVGIGGAALRSAIQFESAFAGVRKTVDATEEQFATLEQGIRDLSTTTPATAEDIARVAEAAGQLGIQTDSILGFTETMIGLGESTNMTADEAATALARFANIVQMPQDQFNNLGSVIVELGNNLATTEAEITELGLRLAGAGAQIGLSEAEIMGFAGALSSVGVSAEAGGTAFSRVFLNMQSAVIAGGEDLDKFASIAGTTSDEFAAQWAADPVAAIETFVGGLNRISTSGGDVAAALDTVSLGEIRVRDALLRISGAGDVMTDSVNLATAAWDENNALQEEVSRRYETTESKLEVLRNQVSEAVRTLGEALVPVLLRVMEHLEPVIAAIQSAADWFMQLDGPMQTAIVTGLGVAAALGPILLVVGQIAGGISALIPIVRAARPAFLILRAAAVALSGPIGWIVTGVGLLVTAFATDFMGIRTAVETQFNAIRDSFQRWGEVISTTVESAKGLFRGFVEWAGTFFADVPGQFLQFGRDIVEGLTDGITGMLSTARDAVGDVAEGVTGWFKNLLGIESPSTVFRGYGVDIGQGLADGIDEGSSLAVSAVDRMGNAIKAAGQAVIAGAFTTDNIVGGIVGDLDGQQAARAIQDRLALLRDERFRAGSMAGTAGRLGRNVIDTQIDALNTELQRLRETLRQTTAQTERAGEVQASRFARSVSVFDSGVRQYTLAKQRY